MEQKRALAILGTPRAGGNVASMLRCAAEAAEAAGWQVDVVDLYRQNIAWCTGCMACKTTQVCRIEDDVVPLREKLLRCDAVILAAPVYFANVPGPVKNMLDRLVGSVMDDNSSALPKPRLSKRQKYLLLTACNTPAPFDRLAGQSTGALRAMKEVFHIAGMASMGSVVFAGTRGKTELPPPVIQKIRRKFL